MLFENPPPHTSKRLFVLYQQFTFLLIKFFCAFVKFVMMDRLFMKTSSDNNGLSFSVPQLFKGLSRDQEFKGIYYQSQGELQIVLTFKTLLGK